MSQRTGSLPFRSSVPDHPHPLPNPASTGLPTVSTGLRFPECRVAELWSGASSGWLLLLPVSPLNVSVSFHGLIAHCCLVLNIIPFSACTTVYLSSYLLKESLVAYRFWQWQLKLLWTPVCRYLYICSSFGVKTKKPKFWILWWECLSFCKKLPNWVPKWSYHIVVQ